MGSTQGNGKDGNGFRPLEVVTANGLEVLVQTTVTDFNRDEDPAADRVRPGRAYELLNKKALRLRVRNDAEGRPHSEG